jgi:ribosome-binding protein aMBF1 (putative translation factor)
LFGCESTPEERRKEAATMYGNPQRRTDTGVQDLRREGGRWLKDLREAAGLSQRQLAAKVDAEYYTFISQLETGRGRIPPDRYADWAKALGVRPKDFVRQIMRYYDPITFAILFDS